MQHEDPDRDDVGVTQVVDEAADIAIVTGINAVNLSILGVDRVIPISTHLLASPAATPSPSTRVSAGWRPSWLQKPACGSRGQDTGAACPPCCPNQRGKSRLLSHRPPHQRSALQHTYWTETTVLNLSRAPGPLSNLNPCNPLPLLSCHHGEPPGHSEPREQTPAGPA